MFWTTFDALNTTFMLPLRNPIIASFYAPFYITLTALYSWRFRSRLFNALFWATLRFTFFGFFNLLSFNTEHA
jgi:hypothetical protein